MSDSGTSLALRLRAALAASPETDLIWHDGSLVDHDAAPTGAAVLIPITDRPEPGVILTKRPDTMRKHPGQVAFPGGRIDAGDANAVAAALREAEEEIALSPALVDVVTVIDPYRTVTGYAVTQVIGVIPPDLQLHPNDDEVAAIFEVPLAFLLDQANHVQQTVDWEGAQRQFWEMHWDEFRIWGATAAMIVNLSRRMRWPL